MLAPTLPSGLPALHLVAYALAASFDLRRHWPTSSAALLVSALLVVVWPNLPTGLAHWQGTLPTLPYTVTALATAALYALAAGRAGKGMKLPGRADIRLPAIGARTLAVLLAVIGLVSGLVGLSSDVGLLAHSHAIALAAPLLVTAGWPVTLALAAAGRGTPRPLRMTWVASRGHRLRLLALGAVVALTIHAVQLALEILALFADSTWERAGAQVAGLLAVAYALTFALLLARATWDRLAQGLTETDGVWAQGWRLMRRGLAAPIQEWRHVRAPFLLLAVLAVVLSLVLGGLDVPWPLKTMAFLAWGLATLRMWLGIRGSAWGDGMRLLPVLLLMMLVGSAVSWLAKLIVLGLPHGWTGLVVASVVETKSPTATWAARVLGAEMTRLGTVLLLAFVLKEFLVRSLVLPVVFLAAAVLTRSPRPVRAALQCVNSQWRLGIVLMAYFTLATGLPLVVWPLVTHALVQAAVWSTADVQGYSSNFGRYVVLPLAIWYTFGLTHALAHLWRDVPRPHFPLDRPAPVAVT